MIRAVALVPRAAVQPERVIDRITLDHGERHRRRVALTGQGGLAFLLDLDRAAVLEDGDALALEDGRLVEIRAAPERLVEITSGDPLLLKKVIWHLGNRHVPTEITDDAVYIAEDHVLIDMLRGLGARARLVERPFRPERGAYEGMQVHEH
jgi:urease accessory protein